MIRSTGCAAEVVQVSEPIRRPLDLTALQLDEALDALGFDADHPGASHWRHASRQVSDRRTSPVMTRTVSLAFALLLTLVASGCGNESTRPSALPPSARSQTSRIQFGGLTTNRTDVITYSEAGYVVSRSAGNWMSLTTYGNPAPFIQFTTEANTTTTGEVTISSGGGFFSFESIDLYSSVTQVPYEIVGLRGRDTVLSVTGTLGNTFGNFRTVTSDRPGTFVDTLFIRLTNTTGGAGPNPMGFDNLVLSR
jgi:hypothetical protein